MAIKTPEKFTSLLPHYQVTIQNKRRQAKRNTLTKRGTRLNINCGRIKENREKREGQRRLCDFRRGVSEIFDLRRFHAALTGSCKKTMFCKIPDDQRPRRQIVI